MAYVREASKAGSSGECFFCKAASEPPERDEEHYVVYRGRKAFAMLNLYPYNTGHLMVAPYKHAPDLLALDDDELLEIAKLLKLSMAALKKAFSPDAFNIGANIGRDAGAGVEGHVHFHVVPRWRGDTNFMPVICKTKVIPQALSETYAALKKAFEALASEGLSALNSAARHY